MMGTVVLMAACLAPSANLSSAAGDEIATATDSDGDGTLDQSTTSLATQAAETTGEMVEDLSQRTETSSIYALGNGIFRSRDFGGPVRIERDGEWLPVDYRLKRQADGSFAPAASPIDMTVSPGGNREIARLDMRGDESMAFTWPQELPAPTVDGGVATYRLSDSSDLLVSVTGSGVTTRIRLNKEPAVDDPAFNFGVQTDSLRLTQEEATGALEISDADGRIVGGTTQLLAWDASTDRVGDPTNIVELNADLTKRSSVGDVTNHNLELTAPDGFLSDPGTRYPVTIDPDISLTEVRDTWVRAGQTTNYGTDYRLIVGKVDPETSSNSNPARSYLKLFSQTVDGTEVDVFSAELGLWQYYGESCTARRMYVYPVDAPWTAAMTWDNRAGVVTGNPSHVDTNRGSSGCGAGWTKIDVKDIVQQWSWDEIDNNGLRLHAADEERSAFERRFCSMNPDTATSACGTAARIPYLDVVYTDGLRAWDVPEADDGNEFDAAAWASLDAADPNAVAPDSVETRNTMVMPASGFSALTCIGKSQNPHWSKGAKSVIGKVNVWCIGNSEKYPAARVRVWSRMLRKEQNNEYSPVTVMNKSDETVTRFTNGDDDPVYNPRKGQPLLKKWAWYRMTFTVQIVSPVVGSKDAWAGTPWVYKGPPKN